jgi:malonyl-CoA O-methyltransferase
MINPIDSGQIRPQFNRAALTYDRAAFLPRTVAETLLQRLSTIRMQPKFIFDLGCRTGYSTQGLYQRYPAAKRVAVEQGEGFLQQLQKKECTLDEKAGYVCSGMYPLPFQSNCFDLVYSNLALHWSADYAQTLAEIDRVLRPGGLFLFSTVGVDTLTELRACWQKVDDKCHIHLFPDMHDLGDSLLQAGLTEPVLDVEYFTIHYHHFQTLLQDLKELGVQNLASDRHRGLTSRKTFQLLAHHYEQLRMDTGKLPVTWEIIYGQAWKPMQTRDPHSPREAKIAIDQIGGRKTTSKLSI